MKHLNTDALIAFARKEGLKPQEKERIEGHLAGCEKCQEAVKLTRVLARGARRIREEGERRIPDNVLDKIADDFSSTYVASFNEGCGAAEARKAKETPSSRHRLPPIIIKTRKFRQGAREMREILAVSALTRAELPPLYLEGLPHVYQGNETVSAKRLHLLGRDGPSALVEGQTIDEESFQRFIARARKAGKRLSYIPYRPWEGEETFEI